jgi:hypothetical protein
MRGAYMDEDVNSSLYDTSSRTSSMNGGAMMMGEDKIPYESSDSGDDDDFYDALEDPRLN